MSTKKKSRSKVSSQTKKISQTKSTDREIISKKELTFFGGYVVVGLLLAVILLAFKISFSTTLSKFYGFIYMFFVPGLFIFRAIYPDKVFGTLLEEYGYPVLISWILHSVLIAIISGVFKTAISDLNLYGTSFIILLLAVAIFYVRRDK